MRTRRICSGIIEALASLTMATNYGCVINVEITERENGKTTENEQKILEEKLLKQCKQDS